MVDYTITFRVTTTPNNINIVIDSLLLITEYQYFQ